MKKMLIAVVAAFALIAMTVPAMATDMSFDGQYRIRQITNSRPDLTEDSASDSWQEMRFRMQTVFTVNDNLSLTTRFDALDGKKFGEGDKNTGDDGDNIDFDRAYMTIKSDFGTFTLGRQGVNEWGTWFLNGVYEGDRLMYTYDMDDITVIARFTKGAAEADTGSAFTDSDNDIYEVGAIYKMEDITAGAMFTLDTDKGNSDRTAAFNPATDTMWDLAYDSEVFTFAPYATAKFGDIGINFELAYSFGTAAEFDRDVYLADVNAWQAANGAQLSDVDKDSFAYNLEATYDMAPFAFEIGYAWAKGDDNPLDDTDESTNLGADWEKLFILTAQNAGLEEYMGPHGGVIGSGNLTAGDAATYGAKIFYLGATFSPMEDLTLGLLFGNSKAESAPAGVSQDHGSEYDLTVNYKVYDNLSYQFIFAYLDAGDFWQGGDTTIDLENSYTLFQEFKLSF